MIILFLLYRAIHSQRDDARYYILPETGRKDITAAVEGQVERVEFRRNEEEETKASIYLNNCKINIKGEEGFIYSLKRLVAYCDGKPDLEPGNSLRLSGSLLEFSEATNPGQFDQKKYYREKGIYYGLWVKEVSITDRHCIWWKSMLCHFCGRMGEVYEQSLPQRESGIVTAMILGDKTLLDMDIKKLYQESGIGHLLAISGLHVTILGMAFYGMWKRLGVPVGCAVSCCVPAILGYGYMTGFSISTSRAAIMMILLLAADWAGRTYDGKSALAFSGICILLQKPFALFSCSFLLSFGSVAGMEFLLPVLQDIVFGGERENRERRRRSRRRALEYKANGRLGSCIAVGMHLWDKAVSLFLAGLSVQLATLPVLLYFFFEIPVYGLIINLLVIPLASLLVLLSFLGGAAGCFILPLGKILLGIVYHILQIYQWVCRVFQSFPGHMQILGRPAAWKIVLYYAILFLVCAVAWYRKRQEKQRLSVGYSSHGCGGKNGARQRLLFLFAGICGLFLLFVPFPDGTFRMAMLDVGQGDSFFLHTPDGQDILLDGGSTSVSGVGTYRILPFLKCSGVQKIDYMIMTHCDEDHMNGLLTVLEESGKSGIAVKNLVMPDVEDKQEAGYRKMTAAARRKGTAVRFLWEGCRMESGELSLVCLNPSKNDAVESANAGSVTLSLQYKGFSCLLTGDLEGNGEEHVKGLLREDRGKYHLPSSYTVLKVAHHGSRNSSDEEFLNLVSPQVSLISCGKDNRYGHPHAELLQRLASAGSRIYRTDCSGAVFLCVREDGVAVKSFK